MKRPRRAQALDKAFCSGRCFHDEYLDTFNRPNVHLVDTRAGASSVSPKMRSSVDGKSYELDCLIYASGFEVGTDYSAPHGF